MSEEDGNGRKARLEVEVETIKTQLEAHARDCAACQHSTSSKMERLHSRIDDLVTAVHVMDVGLLGKVADIRVSSARTAALAAVGSAATTGLVILAITKMVE